MRIFFEYLNKANAFSLNLIKIQRKRKLKNKSEIKL